MSNLLELTISLCLEVLLMVLLFRRGVRRHFPVFFAYVLVAGPVTAARLVTASHYHLYFYLYWWSNAVLLLLGLAALHEVFRWVYEGFYSFWWFRLLYFGAIAAVLIISIQHALFNPPVQADPLIGLILNIGIAVNLLQAGIAALFGVLAKPFVIEFRRYPFGIAGGFAASSLGPFIGYFVRSVFGNKFDSFTQNASAVAYILALVLWLIAFWRPEPEESAWNPPMPPEEMLRLVRNYLDALGVRRKQ